MSDDQAWRQAQELAQAGKMDEAVVTTIKAPNPIDVALRLHVKKTADELPDDNVNVLFWASGEWNHGYRFQDAYWTSDEDQNYYYIGEIEYWLPLPTFNPEREG